MIYNGALFGALTLSAFTAFLLARRLSGTTEGGLVAGAIFAFAPYRFDHYMHLELQIVFWIPLALLALHRIVADCRIRDGVLLGVAVAAQALSSMYAAIYFVTYCALLFPLLALAGSRRPSLRVVPPLLVGAMLTLAVALPYALAYASAARSVGTRSIGNVAYYSATLANYIASPPMNRLYGHTWARFGANELFLFPGLAAILLATLGVFAGTGRARLAYLGGLVLAFDMSRGVNGAIYPLLFDYLRPFHALRSAARVDILVNLSLAVLSAYGVAWLLSRTPRHWWRVAAAAILLAVPIVEYASSPVLARAPSPLAVDRWLARQPPVVVLQLPMSRDWLYMYQGISHGQRMLNGYSGYPPASYYATRDVMRSFPDDRSIAYLQERHVDYVIVRGEHYSADDKAELLARIHARTDLALIARFPLGDSEDSVYALQK